MMASPITVFTARKIVTMNDSQPTATAVAVRDGTIVSVGSLDELRPWLDAHSHAIDRRFADKVILPGFIDPHLHPFLAATTLYDELITALEWRLPWGTYPAVRGREAYLARLREVAAAQQTPADEPLITWGYHPLFHGAVTRADLDAISSSRPLVVWHRSAHEVTMNTAALQHFGLDAAAFANMPQTDYAQGHFWEAGLMQGAAPKLAPFMFERDRYLAGTALAGRAVHHGGVTTIAEFSFGVTNPDLEWLGPSQVLDRDDTPFRVYYLADVQTQSAAMGFDEAFAWVESLPKRNTHHLRFLRSAKLFADGAFFSQLMQLGGGYVDGHHGEWMTPPETLERLAGRYWEAGYKLHIHANGDLGIGLGLDILQRLLNAQPRFDHRFTFEHFGYSTPDQVRKIARLGALVSCNPYYLHELGDAYSLSGLGADRAAQMVRAGSVVRAGVPLALHSDCPMAPAQPLLLAWCAVNRATVSGAVLAPEERITVEQALRAITIDAAFILGVEEEIGSIVAGKTADFTVLEQDPYSVLPEALKDVPIWGTVFEGTPYPCEGKT
jgi:predicted amidohydrolase YtcJ